MIYKYIRKKLIELPLADKLKNNCICQIDRLSMKEANREQYLTKSDLIIKICMKLIKQGQFLKEEEQIQDGFRLLEFIKALTMQVYENNRIEIYLIKIRTYLLTIKWSKLKKIPLNKLISRVNLFLEQIKSNPIYDAISSDYYSHLQRLYLQVIRQKIRDNDLIIALKLIGFCFQSFKTQIGIICSIFDTQQKKIHRLIEKKLELLSLLFIFQHAIKYTLSMHQPKQITAQILSKYQKITFKIPIIHFPHDDLILQCESLWKIKLQKSKRSTHSDKKRSISVSNSTYTNVGKIQKQRQSIEETIQYLNDFFKKKSASVKEFNIKKASEVITPSHEKRTSYFKKENLQNIKQNRLSQISQLSQLSVDSFKKQILKETKNVFRDKKTRSIQQIIQPKKFKLVLQMDRQTREKVLKDNPFKKMSIQQLNILAPKKQTFASSLIFFAQN